MKTHLDSDTSFSPNPSPKPNTLPFKIIVAGVVAALIAAAVTNPSQSDYVDYASDRLIETLEDECDEFDQNSSSSPSPLTGRDICKASVGIVSLARGGINVWIDSSTKRQNFGVFSVYTTNIWGREFKTLGVGNRFFELQS